MYVYVYIYIYVCIHIYIYICISNSFLAKSVSALERVHFSPVASLVSKTLFNSDSNVHISLGTTSEISSCL